VRLSRDGTSNNEVVMHQICEERRRLFAAYQKAASNYGELVRQLADLAGTTLAVEIDFVRRKTKAARQLSIEARNRLNEHAAEHKC
jgi:hypothetical protein